VADLTTRYRFIERYGLTTDPRNPQAVVQTKVDILETIKSEIEKPQGAPARTQYEVQTIYTERPAELGTDGAVISAVRRYDRFLLKPDNFTKPGDAPPLQGLSVWYQRQQARDPLVLCLTEGRLLREMEFGIITRQTFIPALAAALPQLPSRMGERWRVAPSAARAMLGPQAPPDEVVLANFKDLQTAAKGKDLVATFSVTAQSTPFQAEIQFTFARAPTPTDDSQGSTVFAYGYITSIRLAQSMTTPLPEGNGRLRQTQTRELSLARKRDDGAALLVPATKPTPTQTNSWLNYVDPQGRFYLQHPQSFVRDSPTGDEQVILVQQRPDGADVFTLLFQVPTGDAAADRRNRDPEFRRKELAERWRLERQDVVLGSQGWLPDPEWGPSGMKVYRLEAVSRGQAGGRVTRLHLDWYLVLTSHAESVVVTAETDNDTPLEFRKVSESIIKTFHFGPPGK
jgi:hypothetical protein